MDSSLPKKGVELSDQLYNQYQTLLDVVGQGNLLKQSSAGVSSVFDETNPAVSALLSKMKSTLSELRFVHDFCVKEMKLNAHKMPTIEELIAKENASQDQMEVDRSPEYMQLKEELRKKNEDLKHVIDEVQNILKDIDELTQT